MDLHLLIDNLTNPALLFFFLGLFAVQLKSDLAIPENSSKFISIYLLFSIGFKGGQELSHSEFDSEVWYALAAGLLLAVSVPLYTFLVLKRKLSVENAGAIAASYGSVSAVTFITAISFLNVESMEYGGHMVAVMAFMEAPSIIVGMALIYFFAGKNNGIMSFGQILKHSITNGSVLLILGSLLIGFISNEEQARGIEPFTTDIFKGFLAIFLLDMGIASGKGLATFFKNGWFTFWFAIIIPLINGSLMAILSGLFLDVDGNRFLLSILAASASYIAVPAAMRMVVPKANPSLYIPMALAVTFPFNITLGMPIYLYIIQCC
ncbi:MAG: sodium-dependent bicarbonate transport family permease [Flavobacteriales bacterium]|nr:sodium-dependent bicarbonate transport family permease [Flavobacteriales bacterium]